MKVTTAPLGASPAERPSIARAADALARYALDHPDMPPEQAEAVREIGRRLERLAVQFDELMSLNDQFMALEGLSVQFDPATDTLICKVGGLEQRIQLRRADPAVPIELHAIAREGAWLAGSESIVPEEPRLRLEMESKLESFYQSAHRILKLFGSIPALAQIRCAPVTRVRNNLVEHPASGQFYSFGYGTAGPRVKPMHRGEQEWNDAGLVANTTDFVDAILDGIGAPSAS